MTQPVILITGGSRGIGAATARLAAQAGYTVCIGYVSNQAAAHQVVTDIQAQGGQALAVQVDVADETSVLNLFAQVDQQFGRLDALVNNAGVVDWQCRVQDMSAARIQRMLAINVLGPFLCAREAVRSMSTALGGAGGVIVNVTSRAASLGSPNSYVDYAASKAAINTMTLGLAKEVATEGIRVAAVAPGIIDTDIHASGGEPDRLQRMASTVPMQRGGTPEEVAQAILWLVSDQASYVTGTVLEVAGGR